MVTIKSKKEIELMREACKVVALTYEELEKKIKPGMTTWEVDQIAEKKMRSLGAIPAEKGYDVGIKGIPPFPATICISINDEVIHGIPSKNRIIKDGDIVRYCCIKKWIQWGCCKNIYGRKCFKRSKKAS